MTNHQHQLKGWSNHQKGTAMHNSMLQIAVRDIDGTYTHAVYAIQTQTNTDQPTQLCVLAFHWAEDAPTTPAQYHAHVAAMQLLHLDYRNIMRVLTTAPEPDLPYRHRIVARIQRRAAQRLITNMYKLCIEHNLWAKENYESRLLARHNTNDNTLEQSELYIITNTIKNRNHAHAKATNRNRRTR